MHALDCATLRICHKHKQAQTGVMRVRNTRASLERPHHVSPLRAQKGGLTTTCVRKQRWHHDVRTSQPIPPPWQQQRSIRRSVTVCQPRTPRCGCQGGAHTTPMTGSCKRTSCVAHHLSRCRRLKISAADRNDINRHPTRSHAVALTPCVANTKRWQPGALIKRPLLAARKG